MLSLQVITQLKIRLTADNFISFKKALKSFNQKIMFFDNFIRESTFFDNLNIKKKKSSILNLIKNIQEFDSLCRQISNQFCEKSEENLSFVLIRNEILKKMNHVFVSEQKTI